MANSVKLYRLPEKTPDAVLDPTIVLTHCPRCHRLRSEMDLTAYVPKLCFYDRSKEPKGIWSGAFPALDIDYVLLSDFRVHYTVLEKYGHSCEKCGTELELISEQELRNRKRFHAIIRGMILPRFHGPSVGLTIW